MNYLALLKALLALFGAMLCFSLIILFPRVVIIAVIVLGFFIALYGFYLHFNGDLS